MAWIVALPLASRYLAHIGTDRVLETTPPPFSGRTLLDFRDAVWFPARSFLAGSNPYDTVKYLENHPHAQEFDPYTPGHLTLWSPIGTLPWGVAVVVYLVLSGLVVCAVGAWGGVRVLRQLRDHPSTSALVTAAAAGVITLWLTRPLLAAVSPGQPSTFYALLAVPAIVGVRSRLSTALLVGVACLKPQIGLPVLVVLLAQRRTSAIVAGLGVAAALSAPAVLILAHGPAGIPEWLGTYLRNAEVTRASPFTGGAAAALYRIDLEALGLSVGWSISTLTFAFVTAFTLVLVYGAQQLGDRLAIEYVGTTLALAIGLMSLSHGYYDACWLVVPTAMAVAQVVKSGPAIRLACAPGLIVLILSQFTASLKVDAALGQGTGVAIERALLVGGILALCLGLGRLAVAGDPRHGLTPITPGASRRS
ncbi:glycosyltransferase family 87 protein [Pseudonocardia sp. Cha107L01]|uniref:glycosyltransferase family 87 protein n=1 Tax=Pseudonocardia sp. Cha107L01 TaxID=3457576 RepID=UPI00403E3EA6